MTDTAIDPQARALFEKLNRKKAEIAAREGQPVRLSDVITGDKT